MRIYVRSAEGLNSKQRIRIAKNSSDPKELSRLAYDNSRLVRLEVLDNENTPQKVVEMLCQEFADDEYLSVREAVAERTNDPEILAKLTDDESANVRAAVAERTNDTEILAKLADDESANVRAAVAKRTNDTEILAKLADDESANVRETLAAHTNDPEIFAKLADDEYYGVRRAVARHTNDPEIFAKLADDEYYGVRRAVAERTNDPEIFAKLADDESANVRAAVAKRTDDPGVLAKFADDESAWVRWIVAEYTDDSELLAKLAGDKKRDVRDAARNNPAYQGATQNRSSESRKSAQTDWSIPLYSISNYTEIEDEIDQVIEEAANAFAKDYDGSTAKVECPSGVFDNGGQITIEIGNDVYEIDAEDILPPATSKNKKKDCVKTLISWMERNLR